MKIKTIRRFPRYPDAQGIGKVTRDLWRPTLFSVHQDEDSTRFIHTLPFLIPERIRRSKEAHFRFLFQFQLIDVAQELQEAYKKAKYKGMRVSQIIDRSLRSAFQEAIKTIFMKAKRSGHANAVFLSGGRREFEKAARPRRVGDTKTSNRRAIRLAKRYQVLKPKVSELRRFIRMFESKADAAQLRKAVETRFAGRWIGHVTTGDALRDLPDVPGYEHKGLSDLGTSIHGEYLVSLEGLDWTVRQMTAAIIACEEKNIRPKLGASTILKHYIRLGNRLIAKARPKLP